MVRALLLSIVKLWPWTTRYFVVSNIAVDRIEPGLATLVRKRGRQYSYLYMVWESDREGEHVPDTDFLWGRWLPVNMRKHAPVCREVDELDAFVLIHRAAQVVHGGSLRTS